MNKNKTYLLLFLTHLVTRLVFIFIIGFYNNYSLQSDSAWLVALGNKIVEGDFNFELDRFIVSPLFPVVCGLFKIIFTNSWDTALIIFQFLISALSGVYIFKIAELIFKNIKISLLSSLIYAVSPMTIWYTNTFSQELLFQTLFIFSFYHLLKSLDTGKIIYVIYSAIFFSLSYLTKSHILLFSIFIPLIFFHYYKFTRKTFLFSFVFAGIALLFSLPYGLYNYKNHEVYVISSNGAGFQFYLGNTTIGYKTVIDVPDKESWEFSKLKRMDVSDGYFDESLSRMDSILNLSQKEKQKIFFQEGIEWIKQNPIKTIKLKLYNAFFYVMPGVFYKHYTFWNWFFSFILSLPIYICAYISIVKQLKKNFRQTGPVFYLFITMFLFSTVWFVQNRFRTITIEPVYIVYSASILYILIEKIPLINRAVTIISNIFTRS